MARRPSRKEWLLACGALADLVRDGYPPYPLADIVRRWGGAEADVVEAVAVVEAFMDGQGK